MKHLYQTTRHNSGSLGNTEFITDAGGYPYQFFYYSAFGESLVQQNSYTGSFATPYKFNAKEQDPEPSAASSRTPLRNNLSSEQTGNYYYGARYYNPQTSIWFGVDAKSHWYPNTSPYAIVENNPINYFDPNGNFKLPADFRKNYPNISNYIMNHLLNDVASNPAIVAGLQKWESHNSDGSIFFTEEKIMGIFGNDSEPTLHIFNQLPNAETVNKDKINISPFFLNYIENGLKSGYNDKVKQMLLLRVLMLLTHEGIHVSEWTNGAGPDGSGEKGDAFEFDAFGPGSWEKWYGDNSNDPDIQYQNSRRDFDNYFTDFKGLRIESILQYRYELVKDGREVCIPTSVDH